MLFRPRTYISTRLFPRALPCVATFSDTGTFVCFSPLLLRSLVFGVDFCLSRELAFGITTPSAANHNAMIRRGQRRISQLYSQPIQQKEPHGQKTSRRPPHSRPIKNQIR